MALLELQALLAPASVPRAEGEAVLADDLLAAARRGERAAFAGLVRIHQRAVFGLALRLTGDRADAEELAQDSFLKLHASLNAIVDGRHLRHWLLRTVSHRAIDRLRHRGRQVPCVGEEAFALCADEASPDDPLLRAALAALLADLPPPARAVLLLRFQEDLDPSDIAQVLGIPVNTVKSHLRRSLEWLRHRLPEEAK